MWFGSCYIFDLNNPNIIHMNNFLSEMKPKMRWVAGLSLFLGLVYLLIPIEAEARMWGMLSILASVAIFLGLKASLKNPIIQFLGFLGFGVLALAQLFPIHAWTFAPMLTDSAESFMLFGLGDLAHVGVLPHLFVFSLALYVCLVFLSERFKKDWKVVSVLVLFAVFTSVWSVVWLTGFNKVFHNTVEDANLQLMQIEIDELQYQLKETSKETTYEESYWEEGDGGYWFDSKELGIRFFVPTLWMADDPNEYGLYPEITSFKGDVLMGEKWVFPLHGAAMGMWPIMEAYKDFYPASESFLYALNGDDKTMDKLSIMDEAYFEYSDLGGAKQACESFASLVLASTACEKIEDLPVEVYQIEYATYTSPEMFSPEFGGSEIVGGLIWFISLEGFDTEYNGFWLHYQVSDGDDDLVHGIYMEDAAEDYLNNSILEGIKQTEDYVEFEVALRALLSSIEKF